MVDVKELATKYVDSVKEYFSYRLETKKLNLDNKNDYAKIKERRKGASILLQRMSDAEHKFIKFDNERMNKLTTEERNNGEDSLYILSILEKAQQYTLDFDLQMTEVTDSDKGN